MKLILMGTNDWVLPAFERLYNEHEIVGVFTRAPAPAGRKMQLQKSPVHVWADNKNIRVYTNISDFTFHVLDYVVVMSYGVIIPDDILATAKFVNIHPSGLPKYRGPSPMKTSLYNGDVETGVCLIDVAHNVDSGDIYMEQKIIIGKNDTNEILENKVSLIAADMLSEFLSAPEKYPAHPQIGTPTFTKKFTRDDTIIDWNKSPNEIHNQVRAIGGRTKINGLDVKILETTINSEQLTINKLQPAGGKSMDWKSFVNGLRGAEIKLGE